ncbi:MAG TPA: hypothetical protein VNX87_22355 [Candidatus Sulfotelmatobacter sp.]|nr:hypothetical protein [Candidatus Sulfotelmatobacter sp.]
MLALATCCWSNSAVLTVSLRLRSRPVEYGGKLKIVESPELEQGVEGHSGKTIAKSHKPAGEETGEAKIKKSA